MANIVTWLRENFTTWITSWWMYVRAFEKKFREGVVFSGASIAAIALLSLIPTREDVVTLQRKVLGSLSVFGFAVLMVIMFVYLAARPVLWHFEKSCSVPGVSRIAEWVGTLTGPERMMEQFGSFFGKAFFFIAPFLLASGDWALVKKFLVVVGLAGAAMALIYATLIPFADGTARRSFRDAWVWMFLFAVSGVLLVWSYGRVWRTVEELDALTRIFMAVAIIMALWTIAFGANLGAAKMSICERLGVVVIALLLPAAVTFFAVRGDVPFSTIVASAAATLVLCIGVLSQPRPEPDAAGGGGEAPAAVVS